MPPEKRDADRLGAPCVALDLPQPLRRSRARARRRSGGRSRRGRPAARSRRREEPRVGRVGIGTADQRDLDDVVGGHHARVARMELAGEPVGGERLMQRVDAIGDVERRPLVALGQEVAHRPIERPRHAERCTPSAATSANDPSIRRTPAGRPPSTRRRASVTLMLQMRLRAGSSRSTTRLTG